MSTSEAQQAFALHQAGRSAEAEAIYRRLLEKSPDDTQVINLLAVLLHQTGRSPEAYELLVRAAARAAPGPRDPWVWNNLGEVARAMGRREEAIAAFGRAIEVAPDHGAAHSNLGLALFDAGKLDEAETALRRAIELKHERAYGHLAKVLSAQRRGEEALEAAQTAVRLHPRSWAFRNTLGNVLRTTNRLDEAIAEFRAALELKPDYVVALHNLGEALAREGEIDAAIDCIRRALAIRPNYLQAHQSLLFMMHYSDRFPPAEIFAEHRHWAELYETPLAPSRTPHINDRSPDRRLRIGYVSPDFRKHPVGYFMRPIFAHHDPAAVEIFAYNTAVCGDAATDFFRSTAHHWHDVFALNDDQLAQQIRADRIDILVDLTLHMAGGRMLTFARKPAPVQATYLGYAHSTGLASMDYKITDPYLDPPRLSEQYHTEQIVRLPETNFCCEPEPDAPPVGELPAWSNGYVTFASFNTLMKTNPRVIETWAKILHEVPRSRLMIVAGGLASAGTQQRVRERFAAHGVTADRLDLLDLAGVEQGLLAHSRADVALDTFPYAGGTTTANALWMGVPVVTLAGQSPIARQGVSFLTNVGLPELIATTREGYISIAVGLARDLDRLEGIRSSLRERMRESPITDGPRFVRHLEEAYRQMWRAWCARVSDDE